MIQFNKNIIKYNKNIHLVKTKSRSVYLLWKRTNFPIRVKIYLVPKQGIINLFKRNNLQLLNIIIL